MIGCYDFCGHYDWTFRWLRQEGGEKLLWRYWDEAIHSDSQQHAAKLIAEKDLQGMAEYWGHTLADEAPGGGYSAKIVRDRFVVEMTDCPSRGFLLRNGVEFSGDYCDHCIGWIGPMLEKSNYTIDHAHNHCGQCYWELRPNKPGSAPLAELEDWKKQLLADWQTQDKTPIDHFREATRPSARQREE